MLQKIELALATRCDWAHAGKIVKCEMFNSSEDGARRVEMCCDFALHAETGK